MPIDMKIPIKIPENKTKIRFMDCDPFNHLNNSRYIDYFMNAREDHILEAYNLDLYKLAEEKHLGWIVSQNRIAYLRPAKLRETVVIQSCIIKWRDTENLVEMRMWDEEKKHLKAIMWTNFVHFNLKTQRPAMQSEELKQLFKLIEIPVEEGITFEDRIKQVKNEKQ